MLLCFSGLGPINKGHGIFMYVQLTIIRSVRSTKIVVRNLREGNTWYEGKRKKQSVTLGFLRKFLLEFKEDKTKICLLYQGYNLWIVYVQRLKRHNEDFVENAFQSKFKLRSQLKKMVERKMEKFLEIHKILEISLRPIKKNIEGLLASWKTTMSLL